MDTVAPQPTSPTGTTGTTRRQLPLPSPLRPSPPPLPLHLVDRTAHVCFNPPATLSIHRCHLSHSCGSWSPWRRVRLSGHSRGGRVLQPQLGVPVVAAATGTARCRIRPTLPTVRHGPGTGSFFTATVRQHQPRRVDQTRVVAHRTAAALAAAARQAALRRTSGAGDAAEGVSAWWST